MGLKEREGFLSFSPEKGRLIREENLFERWGLMEDSRYSQTHCQTLLPFLSRELHIANSHISFQAPHGVLHHPGVYTMCIFGHAQLDRVLDETRRQR